MHQYSKKHKNMGSIREKFVLEILEKGVFLYRKIRGLGKQRGDIFNLEASEGAKFL